MAATDEAMLCRMTSSHWKDGQVVPTYFVSQRPRKGHYRRLRDAVQQAPPYSRIEIVGGGIFREKIILDRPLEIGTHKSVDPPLLISKTIPLTLQADEAYVEGLSVEAESVVCSVSILRGRPMLNNCILRGVDVCGTASPVIQDCRIMDSQVHGLTIQDGASGTYTKNTIGGHVGYSVVVSSVGEAALSYNTIFESKLGQVCVKGSDSSEFVSPSFTLNRITNDAATDQTAPLYMKEDEGMLPSYKLEALPVKTLGMKVCLVPTNQTSAALQLGDIDDPIMNNSSQCCAILVTGSHVRPTFVRNTILSCKQHGVLMRCGSDAFFESNYIIQNKGWGVVIDGSSTTAVFKGNHICGNGGGARVSACAAHFSDGNILFGNRGPQLWLDGGRDGFEFIKNVVRSGTGIGILCQGPGGGLFQQNEFDACSLAVCVEEMACPIFRHCTFEASTAGIIVHKGGSGSFIDCQLNDMSLAGVIVSAGADPEFAGCTFQASAVGAIITNEGRARFTECAFRNCRKWGMDVTDSGAPTVTRCTITSGHADGLHVARRGRGHFVSNLFAGNDGAQVHISHMGDPLLEDNVIGCSSFAGVRIDHGGCGVLLRNVVRRCYGAGFEVSGVPCAPVLRNNYVTGCGTYGLQIVGGAGGTYERNFLVNNARANVSVARQEIEASNAVRTGGGQEKDDAVPRDGTGSLSTQMKDGVCLGHSCEPSDVVILRENVLRCSAWCGAIVERGAKVTFTSNSILDNRQGILVRGRAEVVLLRNEVAACAYGVSAEDSAALVAIGNYFHSCGGAALCSLNTSSFFAEWNVFEKCSTALLLRRVQVGKCSNNVISTSSQYGVYVGTDTHVQVCHNLLNDNTIGVCMAEAGSHATVFDNVILRSTGQAVRVVGDRMPEARFRGNVLFDSGLAMMIERGDLRAEYNLILNCKEGMRWVTPLEKLGKTVEHGTSVSGNEATDSSAIPLTHSMPSANAGAHATTTVQYCFVSCCSVGCVALGGTAGVVDHCLLSNNDIGALLSGAPLTIRSTIVSNSACIGVYARDTSKAELTGSALFKNYINIVITDAAAPTLTRCVLQAPVVFNCLTTDSGAKPLLTSCVLTAKTQELDRHDASRDSGRTDETNSWNADDVKQVMGDLLKRLQVRIGSSVSNAPVNQNYLNNAEMSEAFMKEDHPVVLTEEQCGRLFPVPSLWDDLYDEPPSWGKVAALREPSPVKNDLDTTLAHALPFPYSGRRSAILWPRNIGESGVLGGPGGSFFLHRQTLHGGQVRSNTAYLATGVCIDNGADPKFDRCSLGGHYYRSATATRRMGPQSADEAWIVDPRGAWPCDTSHKEVGTRKDKKPMRTKQTSKQTSLKKDNDVTLLSSGFSEGSSFRGRARYTPPLGDYLDSTTLLGQLLLCGSPSYWRQQYTPSCFKEHCPLLARSMSISTLEGCGGDACNVNSSAVPGARRGAVGVSFSTEIHEHLVGHGVLSQRGARGSFHRCTFVDNVHAGRLCYGTSTCLSRCVFRKHTGVAVIFEHGAVGALKRCDFRENRQTQVFVSGVDASPTIEGNEFSESPFSSIICTDHSTPHIVTNRLCGVQGDAIVMEGGSEAHVQRNDIENCRGGLLYRGGAKGTAEHNTFTECIQYAISITGDDTSPVVNHNYITNGKEFGVVVTGAGAAPYVQSNTLTANATGIVLFNGAGGMYYGNTIRQHTAGVVVNESGGYFCENTITDSVVEGLAVQGVSSSPVMVGNVVLCGKQLGVRIANSHGILARNHVLGNEGHGCFIEGVVTEMLLIGNEFDKNDGFGVFLTSKCRPLLCCNAITRNARGGVKVELAGTAPTMEGNVVKGNTEVGVAFVEGASGLISGGLISSTVGGPAVHIADEGHPILEDVAVVDHTGGGVVVEGGGVCTATRCLFMNNLGRPSYLQVSTERGSRLSNCIFAENTVSLQMEHDAQVELVACSFLGNHTSSAAVEVRAASIPSFQHCLFAGGRLGINDCGNSKYNRCVFMECTCGAEVSSSASFQACEFRGCGVGCRVVRGHPFFLGCIFSGSSKIGLHLAEASQATVKECGMLRCLRGLLVDGHAQGTVCNNRILWNTDNVVVCDDASPEISSNLIYDAHNTGMHIKNGRARIFGNDIFDNRFACVLIEAATGGQLEDNRISFSREDGALIVRDAAASKACVMTSNTLRNNYSPPANTLFRHHTERAEMYRRMENDREKSASSYVQLYSRLESVISVLLCRVTTLASRTVGISSQFGWITSDGQCEDRGDICEEGADQAVIKESTDSTSGGKDPFVSKFARLAPDAMATAQRYVCPTSIPARPRHNVGDAAPADNARAGMPKTVNRPSSQLSCTRGSTGTELCSGNASRETSATSPAASPESSRLPTLAPTGAHHLSDVSSVSALGALSNVHDNQKTFTDRTPLHASPLDELGTKPDLAMVDGLPPALSCIILRVSKMHLVRLLQGLQPSSTSAGLVPTHSYSNLLHWDSLPNVTELDEDSGGGRAAAQHHPQRPRGSQKGMINNTTEAARGGSVSTAALNARRSTTIHLPPINAVANDANVKRKKGKAKRAKSKVTRGVH